MLFVLSLTVPSPRSEYNLGYFVWFSESFVIFHFVNLDVKFPFFKLMYRVRN